MSETASTFKWRKPEEAMKLHHLKKKQKALQARISAPATKSKQTKNDEINFQTVVAAAKRKNPFIASGANKRYKPDSVCLDAEESSDNTLFKLLHFTSVKPSDKQIIPVDEICKDEEETCSEIVKAAGQRYVPIDWTLKTKVRFMSEKPFIWNQKLKISEEASGTTSFARCIDIKSTAASLDTSPNAKFHQCCLYWQHPSLPWMNLFPRISGRASIGSSVNLNTLQVRESLQNAWSDSLRSLFQLIRARQCAYFYMCANNFTVLFRAAGLCGFTEVNAVITPTTRGFRHLLRQEEIVFTMPLKKKRMSDQGYETDSNITEPGEEIENEEDESPDEYWLKSMGIKEEDIKQINYTQEKIQQKIECEVDNSEESLLLIEGVEVQALYNFLINCKSIIATTGPLAGIPPTLLAPVAFYGATMNAVKVRECKVRDNNQDYYSLELTGPILPHTIHNLCAINPPEHSITATFANLPATMPFSKVTYKPENKSLDGTVMQAAAPPAFGKANLSDCGLSACILEQFCSEDNKCVTTIDCLKYTAEDKSYSWT